MDLVKYCLLLPISRAMPVVCRYPHSFSVDNIGSSFRCNRSFAVGNYLLAIWFPALSVIPLSGEHDTDIRDCNEFDNIDSNGPNHLEGADTDTARGALVNGGKLLV